MNRYVARIERLQQALRDRGLTGAVLSYSRTLLYYTGTAQPSYLVILPDEYALFVRNGIDFALRESGLPPETIESQRSLDPVCKRMFPGEGRGERIGAELDILPVPQADSLHKSLRYRDLVDISGDILRQRTVKDPEEISCVEQACAVLDMGHKAAVECLRGDSEITELQLGASIENAHRLGGHEGILFFRQPDMFMSRGPLASGPNLTRISGVIFAVTGTGLSPAVPAGPSRRRIQDGDYILVDVPTCVQGYHADQTRMYRRTQPPGSDISLYEKLRRVSDHLRENLRPGMTCEDAFTMAEDHARQLGILDIYNRFPSGVRAHFVGHGVGLEINEPPYLAKGNDELLASGMVFTLEMHVMQPDGLTLKIEDMVRLTPEGCALLSLSPRELIIP